MLERFKEYWPDVAGRRLVYILLEQARTTESDEERLILYERILDTDSGQQEARDGQQRIWQQRGHLAMKAGNLDAALRDYEKAGCNDKVAEIAQELRRRALDVHLQELKELEQAKQYRDALDLTKRLSTEFADMTDWSPELKRLEYRANLADLYQRALETLQGGDRQTALSLLVQLVALDPTYEEITRYLHLAVTGVDSAELQAKLAAEKKALQEAVTIAQKESEARRRREQELQTQLENERKARQEAENTVRKEVETRRQHEQESQRLRHQVETERKARRIAEAIAKAKVPQLLLGGAGIIVLGIVIVWAIQVLPNVQLGSLATPTNAPLTSASSPPISLATSTPPPITSGPVATSTELPFKTATLLPMSTIVLTASTPTITPHPLAGSVEVSPQGLQVIKGYGLWFSDQAGGKWRIWHLDSQLETAYPVMFQLSQEIQSYDEFAPAVSPDGHQVAFAVGPCVESSYCNRDLYLSNVDGTNVQRLTDACQDESHPSWSPDGKLLTYFSRGSNDPGCLGTGQGIWVIDISTRQTRQLTDQNDFDPVWSPNGRYIAYHSAVTSWKIKVLDYLSCSLATNSCRTWVAADVGGLTASAGWLDSNTLVFASNASGNWEIYKVRIVPNQRLAASRLTNNNWDDQCPAVSSDGKIMVWHAFPSYSPGDVSTATKVAVLYVMNLSGGKPVPLITGSGNARDGFLRNKTGIIASNGAYWRYHDAQSLLLRQPSLVR